jgi:hypothetical protein
MDADRLDCTWCGSAASIEYGICQVCLMEHPVDSRVIKLPLAREERARKRLHSITLPDEVGVAE